MLAALRGAGSALPGQHAWASSMPGLGASGADLHSPRVSRRAETAYRCGLIEGIILITALAGRNTEPPLMYRDIS